MNIEGQMMPLPSPTDFAPCICLSNGKKTEYIGEHRVCFSETFFKWTGLSLSNIPKVCHSNELVAISNALQERWSRIRHFTWKLILGHW